MVTDGLQETLQRYLPFWDKLSKAEQESLRDNTTRAQYAKGSNVHRGHSECVGLLIVTGGIFCTYLLSDEGREVTLYRMYEGDVCILSAACILRQITFEVHIDAQTDAEALIVSAPAFEAISAKNPIVENFAYKLAADRFSDVMWSMQQILFMGFDRRLAGALLDERISAGSLEIHCTHEYLARQTGSAREVVSRMLKRFVEDGIVELSRGRITILDEGKLRELAR
ncbi:MAG: Crp/Fnr family transcriptional regulator [Bacillota bacterium]